MSVDYRVAAPGSGEGRLWDELVSAAVLGTERRPFASDPLGSLPAGGLAEAAAAMWAYRQAGRLADPVTETDTYGAAPEDARPLLPAGPVRTLGAILENAGLRPVLGEWLALAARDGRRLPPEWLPDLLDACTDADRPALDAAAGPRSGWLAARRPEWAGPGGGPAAALAARVLGAEKPNAAGWDTAATSDPDRLSAFAAVRGADPDRARLLAEHTWSHEPGSTRASILALFADGLTMADEPFLEARLDDRRRDVRVEAAGLLRRLPESRFAVRMTERAVRLVSGGGGRNPGLRILLPQPPDPAARRDGIGDGPGRRDGAPTGRPEDWLRQTVTATSLLAWETHLKAGPADLISRAERSGELGAVLLEGWSAATAATRSRPWAEALLEAGHRPETTLLDLLPAGRADQILARWLSRHPLGDGLAVLADRPRPWSRPVSRLVLGSLAELVSSGETTGAGPVRDRLDMVARAVHPAEAARAMTPLDALEALPERSRVGSRLFWHRPLTALAATVQFRHAMYEEFR